LLQLWYRHNNIFNIAGVKAVRVQKQQRIREKYI